MYSTSLYFAENIFASNASDKHLELDTITILLLFHDYRYFKISKFNKYFLEIFVWISSLGSKNLHSCSKINAVWRILFRLRCYFSTRSVLESFTKTDLKIKKIVLSDWFFSTQLSNYCPFLARKPKSTKPL